jgi:hypothetical protein
MTLGFGSRWALDKSSADQREAHAEGQLAVRAVAIHLEEIPPKCHPEGMKPSLRFLLLVILSLTFAHAEDRGYWRASSSTARSITGDITVADERFTVNFYTVAMSKIRALEPGEVSAVFDTDASTGGPGNLYRLYIPSEKKFLHKNSLCGSESVQWMVAYAHGNTLQVALFSGMKPPTFTLEAISNSTDLCGTFTYAR